MLSKTKKKITFFFTFFLSGFFFFVFSETAFFLFFFIGLLTVSHCTTLITHINTSNIDLDATHYQLEKSRAKEKNFLSLRENCRKCFCATLLSPLHNYAPHQSSDAQNISKKKKKTEPLI